ncbi:PP2C family protein-serine/threonine phosphatase [Streptosporangium roseum]|uniref:Serine phosphatase RsbU regulator of sigma subunit-like protein n=1 Tax=Streptosporangium roseum (strain ATCC 12428 / DSM 43021 / JCM 3005 / KCTC 9067 / NCIMB 10171 / NRRL 2505 / NI 9100) TaxID=479432 RepID=D2B5R5_STRRD|nr:PP2C family protein-serine/threonine phosphatase [Streptosporangium roseum]ACZ91369.1 Serine phosphatase RsbU regulator of sigma subunit-like protein [Streptosporangium roseum DSM 43021]
METSIGAAPLPGTIDAERLSASTAAVQAVLDVMPGSASWSVPIRDATGTIVDLLIQAVSPEAEDVHGRRGEELVGLRTRQSYPSVAETPLWQAYLRVMETGTSERYSPYEHVEVADGVPHRSTYAMRIARLDDGLLVTWVRDDIGQRLESRLARTEHLGNLGWGRWNMVTGEIVWSPQLYRIHGRDPAEGPLTIEAYSDLVHSEDAPLLAGAADMWTRGGGPHELEVRIGVGDSLRHIRISAEATLDAAGRPLEIHGIMQDITGWRRAADELASVSRRLEEENQLTAHLQKIIMPVQDEPYTLPGLRVAARYQPAETAAYLGGDWYQAIGLDDGDVLLAVGDVAGNGLAAASAMAKLRHAITALAFAHHDPAEILTVLNRLLCKLRPDVLATALVARYRPADRTLRWTHAGHPPMLLARGSHVERLLHPGVLLGVFEDAAYTCGTVRLRPDDLMVMFTDGLIEKRGSDLYEGLDLMSAALTEALRPISPASPDRLPAVMDAMVPANAADDTCILVTQVTQNGEIMTLPRRDG